VASHTFLFFFTAAVTLYGDDICKCEIDRSVHNPHMVARGQLAAIL
jgi:hypothetical protein